MRFIAVLFAGFMVMGFGYIVGAQSRKLEGWFKTFGWVIAWVLIVMAALLIIAGFSGGSYWHMMRGGCMGMMGR